MSIVRYLTRRNRFTRWAAVSGPTSFEQPRLQQLATWVCAQELDRVKPSSGSGRDIFASKSHTVHIS
jgi:hypothetical protein